MKQKIHYLFMLLLMLLTGVGGVKAQNEITVSKTTFTSPSGSVDDYIKYEGLKGTASTSAACYSNELRIYQNGGILKVSVWKEGAKIKSVTVGSSSATNVAYSVDGGEESSSQSISKNGSITVAELNCETISFICKGTDSKSRLNVNNLSVSYVKDATPADPRTPVSLSFPEETFSVTLNEGGDFPQLSVDPVAAASEVVYSSSNTEVAEVNDGVVTPKAAGTTTITAKIEDSKTYKDATASYELTVNLAPVEGQLFYESFNKFNGTGGNDNQWSGSIASAAWGDTDNDGWTNEKGYSAKQCAKFGASSALGKATTPTISIPSGNATLTFKAAAWSGDAATLNLSVSDGSITPATITMKSGEWSEYTIAISGTKKTTITFEGNTASKSRFFLDEVRIVEAPAAAIETPVISLASGTYTGTQTVEITCATADATIMYRTDSENWTEYTEAISVASSTTVYAKAVKGTDESNVVSATYTIIDPYASGQANNPYTVDQAIENTPATGNTDEVYVQGIVSKVDNYDSSHHSITYWISADGTTDGNQVEVYSGKGIDGANFSSINDIQVGDIVVVKGTLKKYNDITEFNYNNQLVSLDRPEKLKHWAKFFVDGEELVEDAVEIQEGQNITFPEATSEINGKIFMGWLAEEITGTTDEAPTYVNVNAATMGKDNVTFYAVYAKVIGEGSSTTIEVTNEAIKNYASGHNSYSNDYDLEGWTGRYAINNNSGTYSLQLGYNAESSKSAHNSHLTTPNCESTITSITINTQNNTASGRTFYLCNATDLGCATSEDAIYGQGSITAQNGSVTIPVTGNANQVHIYPNGTAYIASISLTYGTPATYSDYCTTVVEPVTLSAPIIFHDGGEYEDALTVAIAGEGTIMYKLGADVEATAYTAPITINATTTVTAWAEKDGVKSNEVTKTFTIVEKQAGAEVPDGYYNIMTNDGKYVNVAGRKTVTLVSDNEGKAGTVIRVKADAEGVKVLRSQGVDVPGYAKKAMNYVPEIVQLAVDKLHAEGSGAILGEHGLDAIMEEFNKSFDYNLYLEKSGDAYRIYGRTPSMKPVVDFYAKNKANVDAKLPQLEAFINSAIDKVLEKTGGRGGSILVDFKLHDVWQNMDGTLTEPVDEASTMKFYEEVLTSETNVWNFAYQTAMIYWGNLKNHPRFPEIKDKLGDYAKYIDKVENIRPNFKYYIVPSGSGVDFISQGNEAIINNNASAAWTMQAVTTFQVELPTEKNVTVYPTSGGTQRTYKEYYTTLYTDFAYTLREGVKAYKVTAIDEKTGVAKREEITGTIPAQTPVLLVGVGESNTATLTLSTEAGTAITGNLLVGPDALINEYQIKTPQVVSLFDFAKEILGESAYKAYVEKYEHLMLKNAGTVNNKYFFGLTEDDLGDVTNLRILGMGYENELGFHDIWEKIDANKAFILTNDYDPVKLFLVGDVNRDGAVSIADVTALVNIILGKAKYPEDNDKYDFEAANVNGDKTISIADVTALVNIILGK